MTSEAGLHVHSARDAEGVSQWELLDLLSALERRRRKSRERVVRVYFIMGLLRAHPLLEVIPGFICMMNERPFF